jgi:hypothetical protein
MLGPMGRQTDFCDHRATKTKRSRNVCTSECDSGRRQILMVVTSEGKPSGFIRIFFFFAYFDIHKVSCTKLHVIMRNSPELLYDWRFTANLLVLVTSPLRLTTSNFIFQLNACGYNLM